MVGESVGGSARFGTRRALGWLRAPDTGPHDPRTWGQDRWFWVAFGLGLAVRVVPMILFPLYECVRDECIYTDMARDILAGEGLTKSGKGWLPSPGYPYLLALMRVLTTSMYSVKFVQIALSVVCIGLVYGIGKDLADRRTARIAAMLFALNPTIAWFTNTMWIETVYIFLLLLSASFLLSSWRSEADPDGADGVRSHRSAAGAGLALGAAILFRGVATYLPPFWILAAVYPTDGDWVASFKRHWRRAAIVVGAAVLLVTPYSIYGSKRYGGFMVTDATVGHVMYLGNNDFPPLTFDYGNGMLTQPIFGRYLSTGRKPCPRHGSPVQSSKCEVDAAIDWATANPRAFVARVPLRLAQLLNPNSFLTRHVRWGYWEGLPWYLKETLAVTIVAFSASLTLLGTLAAWARARGPYAMMAVGTTVYTVFTIALMYGMTRFRLPLEALWTVYLAMFLADPRGTLAALAGSQWRLAGALLTLPPLLALMVWFLPTGFPVFW